MRPERRREPTNKVISTQRQIQLKPLFRVCSRKTFNYRYCRGSDCYHAILSNFDQRTVRNHRSMMSDRKREPTYKVISLLQRQMQTKDPAFSGRWVVAATANRVEASTGVGSPRRVLMIPRGITVRPIYGWSKIMRRVQQRQLASGFWKGIFQREPAFLDGNSRSGSIHTTTYQSGGQPSCYYPRTFEETLLVLATGALFSYLLTSLLVSLPSPNHTTTSSGTPNNKEEEQCRPVLLCVIAVALPSPAGTGSSRPRRTSSTRTQPGFCNDVGLGNEVIVKNESKFSL